jgi:hypothetical protein
MKFRYIGSSGNMTAYGYDFRGGNEPEVTDANAIKRLSGNRFFEVVEETAVAMTDPVKNKGGRPRKVQPTEA